MINDIVLIIVELTIIIGLIYFIKKTWQGRKKEINRRSNVMFGLSILIAVLFIPSAIGMLGHSFNSLFHPTPVLAVKSKTVKLTGTSTTGTLKGTTRPHVQVKLKESDGIDHVKKVTESDANGKFNFSGLEPNSDFKLKAINGPNKSQTMHITIGQIPDTAYTKLTIDHSDDVGEIKIKQDDSKQATVTGTASKNSTVELDDNNYNKIKSVNTGNSGKWSFTLKGTDTKKKVEYSVDASKKGFEDSGSSYITVINPNYIAPTKQTKEKNADSNSSDKQKSTNNSKSSENEDEQSFVADMTAYLQNKYPNISFNYSNGTANFIVPDEVLALNKQEMKAYVDPLYNRMLMFSSNEGMKDIPTILVKTQDGSPIARSAVFSTSGYKVYAKK